jgi:hypothetical protein
MAVKAGKRESLNGKPELATEKKPEAVRLLKLDIRTMKVAIRGDSLLCNRMSDESIEKIRNKQEGKAQLPNEPKDPVKCFQQSCHLMPGSSWTDKKTRFGFPVIAFKSAMVEAANDMGMKMTEVKRWFRLLPDAADLVELTFEKLVHDIRSAPNTSGGADIRHRGLFLNWGCILTFKYNATQVTPEELVNLLNAAGFGVGVGAYRIKGKKSAGTFGGWEVVSK